MSAQDIRWIQRFNHYKMALARLEEAVDLAGQRPLSRLEEQGLIQAFEFTHELAWNTLKDFLENLGVGPLYGSKDSTRAAFKRGLLENGEIWMDMIRDRNLTSHSYNEDTARSIASAILDFYYPEFCVLVRKLEGLKYTHPE
ncbi:nucleotidyltransferase substrate binding protein, HI0074 family [Nitrosococcus halophilus Nc 4]|uniref:Nucleotidyltransferase substrate binding protein, HI0074 family n=1 Tax=Nitrosococcus halophilus (strain Nc4) TaxID=472759 RepID=D5BV93_NITHN|nr:nucleotidyltransferase substrate binding protein [Nitrosococcus halophilus]ADE15443.1 nucleotidyltransferase substrate binding protein, HI0074 family [Nitrosococcus halophilus Nc 4]